MDSLINLSNNLPEGKKLIEKTVSENDLGVIIGVRGPAFITLFGVGVGPSRRPYTYPQVLELLELAAIMESALERAHFAAKVQREIGRAHV